MFSKNIFFFFENMFFKPNWKHWILSILLIPISFLYIIFTSLKRFLSYKEKFSIPIISIGNIIIGGSGKTPFVISLASIYKNKYKKIYIILSGYQRKSKNLIQISKNGKILSNILESGDEAMLMAKKIQNSNIIVSKDKKKAINLAIKEKSDLIILDDAFHSTNIKKIDIILFPEKILNYMPLPSGPFREIYFNKYFSDFILYENIDFYRKVSFHNLTKRMILVTAISNPERLNKFLPKNIIKKIYLQDHSYFDENYLLQELKRKNATSILVTEKDIVKMEGFNIKISIIKLNIYINSLVINNILTKIKIK